MERGRPPELEAGDLNSPLAHMLLYLHRNLVMDASERLEPHAGSAQTQETVEPEDDELWRRLEREHLASDPRALNYRRIFNRSGMTAVAPVIELLERLRDYFPSLPSMSEPAGSLLDRLAEEPRLLATMIGRQSIGPLRLGFAFARVTSSSAGHWPCQTLGSPG